MGKNPKGVIFMRKSAMLAKPKQVTIKTRLSHWWNGCAKFNSRNPHWVKEEMGGKNYARCSICGANCWWLFGSGKRPADGNAQKVLGFPEPDETQKYWSTHDRRPSSY